MPRWGIQTGDIITILISHGRSWRCLYDSRRVTVVPSVKLEALKQMMTEVGQRRTRGSGPVSGPKPVTGIGARLRQNGWILLLAAGGALAIPYVLLPNTPFNSSPVYCSFGIASVIAILIAAKLHRVVRLPLLLIGIGQTMRVSGDVLAYNYQHFFGTPLPFPSVADACYLSAYPFVMAGLLLLIRKRTPTHDRASLIDTLIVWIGSGALTWVLLIAPYFDNPTLSTPTKLISIAYPVMDLGAIACAIRLAFGRGRRGTAFYLLLGGITTVFLTDSTFGWLLLHGGYTTGGALDLGWIAFDLLLAAAALHPKMEELVQPAPDAGYQLTRARIAALGLASIAAPVVLVVQSLSGDNIDGALLGICSSVAFLLVILRLLDLVKRHNKARDRAIVLADSGAELIQARSKADIVAVAVAAAKVIVGADANIEVTEPDHVAAENTLVFRLRARGESRGALVVDVIENCDADTQAALKMLANEIATALDGVALAEDLLNRRTEARFQSLVQNATDVIILVDINGVVTFASPSARQVFGLEPSQLEGKPFLGNVTEADRAKIALMILGGASTEATPSVEFGLRTWDGDIEVEASCTNLLRDADVGGLVFTVRDVTERKNFERQLAHQAFNDETTGLANRPLFRDRVEHAIARTRDAGSPLSVLFLDIDDFKTVNDTLGHGAGDELLRIVGGRIANESRAIDTTARLGGDEFAILIEDGGYLAASHLAERLLAVIPAPIELDGRQLSVTASIGLAEAERGSETTTDTLLRKADVAMYAAKSGGKGRYKVFEPEMHAVVLERLELKRALEVALENDEFELNYQPIFDLRTGSISFIEALLRWPGNKRGLGPSEFIPLAEETGLIVRIGAWVLEHAVQEAVRLTQLAGADAPPISVNVSTRQLQRPELAAEVKEVLERFGLAPEKLILEITETAMIEDLDSALERLRALKAQGIRLAIDDFGSGYSSLNYIRQLPVDILKIDRSFIADQTNSGTIGALTRTILDLGSVLEMVPVAEGIEDAGQLDELRRMGCPLGQGYHFMKPTDAVGIEAAVLNQTALRPAA